jgi:Fe-S oxidoreductase
LYECVKNGKSIIGLEPSCILTFRDDYLDLLTKEQKKKALIVAEKTFLLEEFIQDQSTSGILDIQFNHTPRNILLHGHCHQKAITGGSAAIEVLNKVPGFTVKLIDAGCCGMAGSFGFEKEHYDISMKIGDERLFPAIRAEDGDFDLVASGVSCRQQIKHGTKKTSKHLGEILLEAL